ncbi:MAG: zinc-dependent alcohol dehydrogenase family protein [Mariprofundaceae bacterium]|nr:zinc-dependent alcohol dehydrogenase family protein [Mariprofundaceae bacterium]
MLESHKGAYMRAMMIHKAGAANLLQAIDIHKPSITEPNQVLVQVFAAGVNPIDSKLRGNGMFFPDAYPAILGCDGAGVVEAVGSDVDVFSPGDAVYYCYGGLGQRHEQQSQGNYAEYIVVPSEFLARKPESMGYLQAAAAPLILITAWESLFDRAALQSGQKVFIHAGAGGVGHVAIQLAKIAGCEVAATVSDGEKEAFVRQLGADKVIDYTREDVAEALLAWTDGKGVNVALDTVGGDAFEQLIPAMAHYSDLVSILQVPKTSNWKALRMKNVRVSQELMLAPMLSDIKAGAQHHAAILEQCAQLIDAEKLQVHVSKILPLEDAAQAHQMIEKGHMQGKIVLAIAGEEIIE